jgi:hypothetical protein
MQEILHIQKMETVTVTKMVKSTFWKFVEKLDNTGKTEKYGISKNWKKLKNWKR